MTAILESPMPTLAVVSPKGGNGKTTIAVNLAIALTRHAPTILVDLDVHFGDVEYALRLHPVHRLDKVIEKFQENPMADLEVLLTPHPSGISAMCSPNNPVTADGINVQHCFEVVDKLLEFGRPVVIDTAAGISEYTIGAIERSTHTILVSGTDVASVQAGRKLLDTMTQFSMGTENVRLVVNRSNTRCGLTVSDVEAVLGMTASFEVPEHVSIAAATNDGSPITESSADSPISQLFYDFVGEIMGVPQAPKKSFWFLRGHK
jgi:pilus assembly protein CpaE